MSVAPEFTEIQLEIPEYKVAIVPWLPHTITP